MVEVERKEGKGGEEDEERTGQLFLRASGRRSIPKERERERDSKRDKAAGWKRES